MNSATSVPLPGCDIILQHAGTGLQLSTPGSGWFLDEGNVDRQILCGDLDELVVSLLRSTSHRRSGLAVSSVIPGLCLGPALSLAVDSMVSKRIKGEDGHTLLRTDECIAIVSRSHSLRDHLAESCLRFDRRAEFPFMSFPTFRLKRNGESDRARFGRNGSAKFDLFASSPQFLFYDLSPLPAVSDVQKCAVILAELFETDGPQYVERLVAFARACRARYVFPIVSYHDVEKRRELENQGFTITVVTKGTGCSEPDFTFSALSSATPARTRFNVHACTEPVAITLEIDRAYRLLRQMWKACGDLPHPRQLRTAWSLLDEMAAAPSSIATLETVRRDAPRVTTLGFAIEKLSNFDCRDLPGNVQSSLTLRWPHLCEALKNIYESLRKRNPLMEAVIDLIINANEPLTVVTRSDTAAEALRRDLLFDWEAKDDDTVTIGSAAALCRDRAIARRIIAAGFNPMSRPQMHWALLPESFDVVVYPHMLSVLAEYQALVRRNVAVLLPTSNVATLTSIFGADAIKETKAPVFEFVYSDLGSEISIFAAARRTAAMLPTQHSEDLLPEDEMALADMALSAPISSAESEPTSAADDQGDEPYAVIHLVDGGEYRAPLSTVFAALPVDSDEMVKLKATDLSQGDRIVLLSEDEHRSVYSLIAERTRHLFPMNDRALELWSLATDVLRAQFPPNSARAVEDFCDRLELEHCLRGRQSMRHWLRGIHAPEAAGDVEIMLRVAGTPGSTASIAEVVSTELDRYRNFRRTIGRAIVRRTVRRVEGRAGRNRLDEEIDEVLELCDVREVESVDMIDPNAGTR